MRLVISPFLSTPTTISHSCNIISALVILNTPIKSVLPSPKLEPQKQGCSTCPNYPSSVFHELWEKATYRVCADGGANQLFEATVKKDNPDIKTDFIPDLITGDLDSLRPDGKYHYETIGCPVIKDSAQDTTDLDKSLQSIRKWILSRSTSNSESMATQESDYHSIQYCVFIYGAFGGRFDHEMSAINHLYQWGEEFQYNIMLYNEETCAFLLPSKLNNRIYLGLTPFDDEEGEDKNRTENGKLEKDGKINLLGEGRTCGLIPFGGRCESVTTTGLKWNLDGSIPLEFGGLFSTSNRIVEQVVTVQSSQPIVFTVEMRS